MDGGLVRAILLRFRTGGSRVMRLSKWVAIWGVSVAVHSSLPARAQQPADGQPSAKIQAIDAAGDMGPKGAASVASLVTALADSSAAVRWHAARALGAIGPQAAPAVGDLTKTLTDQDAKVRAYSAFALGRIGAASKPAVTALVTAVKDADAGVRREALKAIALIGPGPDVAVPLFIDVLSTAQPEEVALVLHSLVEFGEPIVPRLIKALEHEKARYWVCLVVGDLGPKAKLAVGAIAKILSDPNVEVRREALIALGHIGPDAASAAAAVVPLLDDQDQTVRPAAAWALGAMGAPARSVLPALEAKASDPDPVLAMVCSWAVARLDPTNGAARQRAFQKLAAGIEHDQPRIRAAAIHGLADLQIDDPSLVSLFVAALDDADSSVVGIAIRALVGLGSKSVAPLTQALGDENLRGPAAVALAQIGPPAAS
ncbi:MAG TPA: HEAT repeat domain-containing protein, partial [Pirellulales bacterium]|nr:HEAT repeat domain-containing protein [Pirellulales bacterium]